MMSRTPRSASCGAAQNVSLSHKPAKGPENKVIEIGAVSTLEKAWPH